MRRFFTAFWILSVVALIDAKRLGEWRTLSESPGYSVFDSKGRPFKGSDNFKYCNVRTVELKSTSATNDYSKTIQKILDEFDKEKGGTLKLGPGTFTIGTQLRVPSYTCLVGSGMKSTKIKVKKGSKPFKKSGAIRSFQTERVTIMDLTIDGNKKEQKSKTSEDKYGRYGLFSELTNYLYLKRVLVKNNIGYGFDPHGSKTYWSYYLLIEDCVAHDNGLDGFTLDQTKFVGIRYSTSFDNARHGMNIVTGTRYVVALGNEVKDNGFDSAVGCGIMAQNNQGFGTRYIKILKSIAKNNRKASICLNDVTDIEIADNKLSNKHPKAVCYMFDDARKIKLYGNKCTETKAGKFKIKGKTDYKISEGKKSSSSSSGTSKSSKKSSSSKCSGVSSGSVCCKSSCGTCGGIGCSKRSGGASNCCTKDIKASGRKCSSKSPPCLLG